MTPALTKDELSIIRIIFMQDEATRSEIASHLGTSLIKVSSLLESLEKNGFIYKEERRTKRGRPSYMFRIVKDRFYAIGISFGIDSFRLAVTNTAKDIIHEEEFPFKTDESDKKHIQSVVDTLEKIIRQATDIPAAKDLTPVSVGVSLPGMVDTEKAFGYSVSRSGGSRTYPSPEFSRKRTGVPVFIEDAARTYAFYEKIVGAGKALKISYCSIWTGA
jgi:DNA-binding transcriptional regulator GbsR (MarR family)